jgi:pimeloyl-ACP methyl ester carboxylesterase
MQEKNLVEQDLSLYYRIFGQGEPVVLIHGFAEDSRIWDGMISGLEKEYKLIVPDLAGSGRSTGNTNGITMESMAVHVHMILEKENIETCYMIGHSMGGYITLAFAEKYPDKLKGLGLFHSTVFADSDEKKSGRKKNIDFIEKHGSAKFLEQATPNLFSEHSKEKHPELLKEMITQYRDFSPASLIAYTDAMKNRPDRSEVLKKFRKPVLLIVGEFDTAIPIEQSMKMCRIADFAYIYIGAQSGHLGMLEEPEFCLKAMQDFLSGK